MKHRNIRPTIPIKITRNRRPPRTTQKTVKSRSAPRTPNPSTATPTTSHSTDETPQHPTDHPHQNHPEPPSHPAAWEKSPAQETGWSEPGSSYTIQSPSRLWVRLIRSSSPSPSTSPRTATVEVSRRAHSRPPGVMNQKSARSPSGCRLDGRRGARPDGSRTCPA